MHFIESTKSSPDILKLNILDLQFFFGQFTKIKFSVIFSLQYSQSSEGSINVIT